MAKRALIVVDVQNDFLPDGALGVPNGDAVVAPVNALIEHFDTVVLTQDWHPANHMSFVAQHPGQHAFDMVSLPSGPQVLWPDHCVAGTPGADFAPGLETVKAQAVIRKGCRPSCDSYSGFMEADRQTKTGLEGYLRTIGVTDVVVCGLALDYCVSWTALDAQEAGFATHIVVDASAAIDLNNSLELARRAWKAAGIVETTVAQELGS